MLRGSEKILHYEQMLRCYGVSVWLHESYEVYGTLEKKQLLYDQMLRCYGVTGSRGYKITYILSSNTHVRSCFGMVT